MYTCLRPPRAHLHAYEGAALAAAARAGRAEVVRALLRRGARPGDRRGAAVAAAAKRGPDPDDLAALLALLDAGADPNQGWGPLRGAQQSK
eukprot:3619173-Pyramimonas_sp.AAC.2